MWRTFDYTTYFALCFNMYRIARQNLQMVRRIDAQGHLERPYGTARTFFDVPSHNRMEGGWSFTGWAYWPIPSETSTRVTEPPAEPEACLVNRSKRSL